MGRIQYDPYSQRLLIEALSVGLMNWLVQSGVDKLPLPLLSNRYRVAVVNFVGGALFHVGAEYLGFNEWYLRNGAAVLRAAEIYERVRLAPAPPAMPLEECIYRI